MIVTPIAHTKFDRLPNSVFGTEFGHKWVAEYGDKSDLLGEFAGRSCYQSWQMPNPETATTLGYTGNILDQGHYSVLEHSSVTFYVEGVSRSLTHELIRHRHLSYSELSQRYVDVENAPMIAPPAIRDAWRDDYTDEDFQTEPIFKDMREAYGDVVEALTHKGLTRKRAREAARMIMPNATETKIVVTGNLRAWRDMLGKRWHVAADAEIQEFAGLVLGHLRKLNPAAVQDIPEEPFC